MTPQESESTRLLHSKLGVEQQVAQWEQEHPWQSFSVLIGNDIFAKIKDGQLVLTSTCNEMRFDPATLEALNAYLVKVGWRCM